MWELKNTQGVRTSSSARKRDLMAQKVSDGFTGEIFDFLKAQPKTVVELAISILEANFPSSIHEDILQASGLESSFGILSVKRSQECICPKLSKRQPSVGTAI